MNQNRANLHLHTNRSDGRFSPKEVVSRAVRAGVTTLSITDHDTIDGTAEAEAACRHLQISCISGVEISSSVQGSEVHLLGYAFDRASVSLNKLFDDQRANRRERAAAFVAKLRSVGMAIPPIDEALEGFGSSIGRPHIAKLIVDAGSADTMDEAFIRYLTPGADTFVPKTFPSSNEVIRLVQQAGGVCVMAHPGHFTSHNIMLTLISEGLDGIEINHPAHDESLVAYYGALADRYKLIKTGGSDYHGWRDGDDESLGAYFAPWPLAGKLVSQRTL